MAAVRPRRASEASDSVVVLGFERFSVKENRVRYPIKTLGIGGILDVTVTLVKNHFSLFMGIMLILYLPFALLFNGLILGLQPEFSPDPTPEEIEALGAQAATFAIAAGGMGILFMIFIQPLATAAITYSVANEYLGIPTTVGESIRQGLRMFLSIAWVWIISYVLCLLGLLACILPGIYLFVTFSLASEVVVIEKIRGWAALKRSLKLMRTPGTNLVSKLLGLMGILWVMGFVVGMAGNFIPEIYTRTLFSVLVQSVLMVFATTAWVVFYFSARCEAENFDLAYLAASIGAEEPADVDTDWETTR